MTQENEWIDIDQRFPNFNENVLVYDEISNVISLGKLIKDEDNEEVFYMMFLEDVEIDSNVTHWMPLPQPPKE